MPIFIAMHLLVHAAAVGDRHAAHAAADPAPPLAIAYRFTNGCCCLDAGLPRGQAARRVLPRRKLLNAELLPSMR